MSSDLEVTRTHPVPDPGIEEHVERWVDVDPAASRRAERQVAACFGLVPLLALGFVAVYFFVPKTWAVQFAGLHAPAQHVWLGLLSGLAILLVGIGAVQWARLLMGDQEISEERHLASSDAATREEALAEVHEGIAQSDLPRRKLIGTTLKIALPALVLPALVPLLDMGPWPGPGTRAATIEKTIWAEGIHLVTDVTYKRIKATDMAVGELVNAAPENIKDLSGEPAKAAVATAKAAIIIVRMDPATIKIPASRKDWQVDGILCYSKICTHVGCPISLWEQTTHHLLCPCHQSTFDLGNSGVVVFGPAGRSLPQLPITTDADGYLVARSDFTVPVGPSYFERDSTHDYKNGDN
ncbi:MAG: Rieske (2Fe-2S) protein [Actinobacteria bacterium]|nr:Rieske (2Fe-2S) protein [Actinomycetota bacterium]